MGPARSFTKVFLAGTIDMGNSTDWQKEMYHVFSSLDGRYILFYITATTTSSQLSKLERAIKHIARVKSFKNTYEGAPDYVCGVKKFSYLTALSFSSNEVPLEKAIGKVSAQNIGITPPCFPLIIAGEVITKESVENLKKARYTFGVKEGAVKVIKIGGKA